MLRLLKGIGITLLILFLIFLLCTSQVKRTSFYNEEYYHNTSVIIDSLRKVTSVVTDSLKAGFSRINITPVVNSPVEDHIGVFGSVPLAGYGDRKGKPATGIHDSIYVKAVALETGDKLVILVAADLLIMPAGITDSVAAILSRSGIQREQLFFSATHTHSSLGGWGPGFVGKQFAGEENVNLQNWLTRKISKAVISAVSDLKPASIGSGCFDATAFTRNRLTGKTGTKNNDFCYLAVQQRGGRKAIIGSFSAHATTLGSDNMEISADYPGYWARSIERTSADMALFFAGSTGSQSMVGEGSGFEKPQLFGEALADSLNSCLQKVKLNPGPQVSYVSVKIDLPDYHVRLTTKINLSTFLSNKLAPEPENVYLQALRIDNMVWITTPADFSGEYALEIKNALAAEGFSSNVTSFNGSYVGYIIPGKYFYKDGYESRLMSWFGPEMGDYTMEIIRQITRIVTGSDNI